MSLFSDWNLLRLSFASGHRSAQPAPFARDVCIATDRVREVVRTSAPVSQERGSSRYAAANLHRGRAAKLFALLIALAGCGSDTKSARLVLHSLEGRRAACEEVGQVVSSQWRSAIEYNIGVENYIASGLASRETRRVLAAANIYLSQAQTELARSGDQMSADVRAAVIDASSEVEALCSVARNPAGLNLISFSAKLSDLRTDIDRAFSKVQSLQPMPPDPKATNKLDQAAKEAATMVP